MKEYNEWIEEVKNDLIKQYDKMGLRASGKWANSLESKSEILGGKNILTITGEEYTGALVNGRKPTEKEGSGVTLRDIIEDWIEDKGITLNDGISKESLAFLITRKIHNEGIKVPNSFNSGDLISAVMNQSRIDSLKTLIGSKYMTDIKTTILNEYK